MSDSYLRELLDAHQVEQGPKSPTECAARAVAKHLPSWRGDDIAGWEIFGSYAKGTGVSGVDDVDLFISFHPWVRTPLRDLFYGLEAHMKSVGYRPRAQNVSVRVEHDDGTPVDLVPARRTCTGGHDHNIYRSLEDTWIKTNIRAHQRHVKRYTRQDEIRLVKLWRDLRGLSFPSFYLELVVIHALMRRRRGALANNFCIVMEWLATDFPKYRYFDPGNASKDVSGSLTKSELRAIRRQAKAALEAEDWSDVFDN